MYNHVVHDIREIDQLRIGLYKGINPEIAARKIFVFRGQTREFLLPDEYPPAPGRNGLRMFMGYEPSFVPSAFRSTLMPFKPPRSVMWLLQEMHFRHNSPPAGADPGTLHQLSPGFQFMAGRMVEIAQHYGLATNGVDVTYDLDVAAWFATRQYLASEQRFVSFEWSHISDHRGWPVIYVFALDRRDHGYRPLGEHEFQPFGLQPTRVFRQKCSVFSASARDPNTLADDLVLQCFLHPDCAGRPAWPVQELFPPPELDPMYHRLLDYKRTHRSIFPELSQIIEYSYA